MQSFLAHLHKEHPKSKKKYGNLRIKSPEVPETLIFGDVVSKYGTDGVHGYDASRYLLTYQALKFPLKDIRHCRSKAISKLSES